MGKIEKYSSIMGPWEYSFENTKHHRHIYKADLVIKGLLKILADGKRQHSSEPLEIVEFGCGPARLLRLLTTVENINLTGIDIDASFIRYGRKLLRRMGSKAQIVLSDVMNYVHPKTPDVIVSQGFDHHAPEGYLLKLYDQLPPGGICIISDENFAEYDESVKNDREIKATRWYSYIISSAIRDGEAAGIAGGYAYLAQEEAKTYFDDLFDENDPEAVKTQEHIKDILNAVHAIDDATSRMDTKKADALGVQLLDTLATKRTTVMSGNPTMDNSRHDRKKCISLNRRRYEEAGFLVEKIFVEGPIKNKGAMVVFVLRKPAK